MARLPAGRSGAEERALRIAAWVERSCLEQGVPVKITDRRVLAQVAELLRERPAQSRQNGSSRESSKRL
ncbi:MAG TPA: hypothetical protein VIC05_13510 [Solirubrobacteraceae bacterium]|jgi:hypothetical protein